jgi:hypothetical protein
VTEDDKIEKKENGKPIMRIGGGKSKIARKFEELGDEYLYKPEKSVENEKNKS